MIGLLYEKQMKSPKQKVIRAYAVLDREEIASWQFTKADNHFDIYRFKKDALIACQEWRESSGEGFLVIPVEIRYPVRKK